jgi:hypothetical protein
MPPEKTAKKKTSVVDVATLRKSCKESANSVLYRARVFSAADGLAKLQFLLETRKWISDAPNRIIAAPQKPFLEIDFFAERQKRWSEQKLSPIGTLRDSLASLDPFKLGKEVLERLRPQVQVARFQFGVYVVQLHFDGTVGGQDLSLVYISVGEQLRAEQSPAKDEYVKSLFDSEDHRAAVLEFLEQWSRCPLGRVFLPERLLKLLLGDKEAVLACLYKKFGVAKKNPMEIMMVPKPADKGGNIIVLDYRQVTV